MSQEPTESQEPDLILTSKEEPFAKEGGAVSAMKQKKLEETHEVVPFSDGFAIVRKGEHPPDEAQEPVQEDLIGEEVEKEVPKEVKASSPPAKPAERSVDNMTSDELAAALLRQREKDVAEEAAIGIKSKYFRVRFSAKSDPNQQDDVELSLNGNTLLFKREEEAIIPSEFREVADQAVTKKFKNIPGLARKYTAKVKTFPYEILGPATQKEYMAMKKAGTDQARKNIAQYGLEKPPE